MHPKFQRRIQAILRSKRSEIDADLKTALSDIAELFSTLPILGAEGLEFVKQINLISQLIDATDPNTEYGIAIRTAVIELLNRVNPRLEKIGSRLSEASKLLSEFHAELNSSFSQEE